jgi:hypothetical protein
VKCGERFLIRFETVWFDQNWLADDRVVFTDFRMRRLLSKPTERTYVTGHATFNAL